MKQRTLRRGALALALALLLSLWTPALAAEETTADPLAQSAQAAAETCLLYTSPSPRD